MIIKGKFTGRIDDARNFTLLHLTCSVSHFWVTDMVQEELEMLCHWRGEDGQTRHIRGTYELHFYSTYDHYSGGREGNCDTCIDYKVLRTTGKRVNRKLRKRWARMEKRIGAK